MSLDKYPAKSDHHHQDLLSHDHDLLGGNHDANDFGDFNQAHTAQPPQKKSINFANFKKAQNPSAQQQPEAQSQEQNHWDWDFAGQQANSQNHHGHAHHDHAHRSHSVGEQKPVESKVDLMKLYSQPAMTHQNHFMQGNMYHQQQQWNGHMQGNYNNGWNNGMQMNGGHQNHFQGGYPTPYGAQQGYNSGMGFNQAQMNHNGNMGFGQAPMNGQYGNNMYQNNGFGQSQTTNFF